MTRRLAPQTRAPVRLLGERAAAEYLGISPTNLRGLGLPRRVLGARRLYDVADLEAFADALPYEGESGGSACDEIWGTG
jgi:hypothetical protein